MVFSLQMRGLQKRTMRTAWLADWLERTCMTQAAREWAAKL